MESDWNTMDKNEVKGTVAQGILSLQETVVSGLDLVEFGAPIYIFEEKHKIDIAIIYFKRVEMIQMNTHTF